MIVPSGSNPEDELYQHFFDDSIDRYRQYNSINIILNIITSRYYKKDEPKFISCKEDMIFIIVLDKITIKIYNYEKYFDHKLNELYYILSKNECPNLEHIYEIHEFKEYNCVFVVSKTIDVSYHVNQNTYNNVIMSIEYLKKYNWIHHDCYFDNVGYDKEKNCYVLFDFEKSKNILSTYDLEKESYRDILNLNKSFRYHFQLKN